MRYLTHESEDAWWNKQGAKPHPLTIPQRYHHHVYNNVMILDEPRPGLPSIATTAAFAKPKTSNKPIANGTTPTNTTPTDTSTPPTPTNTSDQHSTDSSTILTSEELDDARRSYISLSNDEVDNLEQHAHRAGFTISTV